LDHPIPFLKKELLLLSHGVKGMLFRKQEKTPFYICALLEAEAITPGRTETLDKR
jgi:hypothetical protein